ncbi:MAG: sigma-54 dependent transcriptional regulator [Fibrobacterales bacterium]
MAKILVVDDEELMRDMVMETLTRAGYECKDAKNGPDALEALQNFDAGLVVSDFKMPGMTGLELYKEVRERFAGLPFIIMTAYGTIETAVELMRMGAVDFVEKPCSPDMLEMVVARALENASLKAENKELKKQLAGRHEFIGGASKGYNAIAQIVEEVADSNATVLVTGESGVGKEVLARLIHGKSSRAGGPFVKINCAALPDTLIESELFGHEKGAFTGALKTRKGKFEQGHKGTLLLDEIGEMPLNAQSKLLRVLQEREVSRLGSDEEVSVDVRVICTTNRDLQEEVKAGTFREDLFYRLNVIPVHIMSLHERKDDIELLVHHFLEKFNTEYGYTVEGIESDTLTMLKNYPWPGNIRQLENAMERAMVFTKSGIVTDDKFDLNIDGKKVSASVGEQFSSGMTVAQAEQQLILNTLEECNGNKTKASEMLDISIRTLRNKLHEYGAFEEHRERGN